MKAEPMRSLFAIAIVLGPATASAKPKKDVKDVKLHGAAGPTGKALTCGAKVLPLAVGNTWTYSMVPSPQPPDDSIKRLSPAQAKGIVITVKSVEAKGTDWVATLEEKVSYDRTKDEKKPIVEDHTYTSTITCNDKTKFDISPNAFFFAGEPGGYVGLDLDNVDRKGTSWALVKGGVGDKEWREDLVMHWTRKPTEGSGAKLGAGKIELERRFTPQEPEALSTKPGMYKAEKIGLITTGRVTLEGPSSPNAKPMELPANWVSQLWIADGVGVVQTLNSYAHMYQLTAVSLK